MAYLAVDERELDRVPLRTKLVMLMALAVLLGQEVRWHVARPPEAIVDKRMESACKMPRYNGEVTLWVVLHNTLHCWRLP